MMAMRGTPSYILPDSKTFAEMKQRYSWKEVIGSGTYGVVMKGKDLETNKAVAIKRIKTKDISVLALEKLRNEVNILNLLFRHPNVMELIEQFEDKHYAYLVLEYANDRTLAELYDERLDKTIPLTERGSWSIIKQLTDALMHCYSRGVVHRDIKPSNVLLHEGEDGWKLLLLADFGFAKRCDPKFMEHNHLRTTLGTMQYMPPEMFQPRSYNYKCDIWSLGVLIFVTLSGSYPFSGSDDRTKYGENVMKGAVVFNPEEWAGHSHEAKDLVRCMLRVDPTVRYNYAQIRNHEWVLSPSFLRN